MGGCWGAADGPNCIRIMGGSEPENLGGHRRRQTESNARQGYMPMYPPLKTRCHRCHNQAILLFDSIKCPHGSALKTRYARKDNFGTQRKPRSYFFFFFFFSTLVRAFRESTVHCPFRLYLHSDADSGAPAPKISKSAFHPLTNG